MVRNLTYLLGSVLVMTVICLVISLAWPGPSAGAIATTPSTASSPSGTQPLSPIATKFASHLMALGADGEPHAFDAAKLAGVQYWAFYYSASWCPPCRAFTPDLVSFYNDFKPAHPNFELIFVNDDRSDGDMVNYMKGDAMPWPAVWFADIENPDLNARQYHGPGIPCLVLVDSSGNVLSDSFNGGQYLGPRHVLDDIRSMVH